MGMDSTENMMPAVETVAPEAPSGYQLARRSESATLLTGPPGFSIPGSLVKKKKRGRPRKYDTDGVVASGGGGGGQSGCTLSPIPISASVPPTSGDHSEIKFGEPSGGGFSEKKKVKMSCLEAKSKHGYGSMNLGDRILSGGSFTPHMVTVNPGEDVTSKIISFTKDGPRSICILSALGVISHVTLRHAGSSGTVTYEGRFEILTLSGSFTPDEFGGLLSRETNMSITLASPDGRVVGGQLGGLLTAAGPVQVVVASFLSHIGSPVEPKLKKQKSNVQPMTRPVLPPTESCADVDQQNLNEHARERPMEKCMTASVDDWRRADTDMNVSLKED